MDNEKGIFDGRGFCLEDAYQRFENIFSFRIPKEQTTL